MTLPTQSFMVLRASLWDRWYFLFSYYMDNIKYSQTRKIHCASNIEREESCGQLQCACMVRVRLTFTGILSNRYYLHFLAKESEIGVAKCSVQSYIADPSRSSGISARSVRFSVPHSFPCARDCVILVCNLVHIYENGWTKGFLGDLRQNFL